MTKNTKNRVKMIITVEGLTPTGALALEAFLAMAQKLGSQGSSRWLALHADGDGDFRPKVEVCVEQEIEPGVMGFNKPRKAKVHKLVDEKKCWTENKLEWRLDPAWVTGNYHTAQLGGLDALRFTAAAELNNIEVTRFVFRDRAALRAWLTDGLPKLQHRFGTVPVRTRKLEPLGPGDKCHVHSCGDEVFTIKKIKRVADNQYKFVMANRTVHDVALCYPVSKKG